MASLFRSVLASMLFAACLSTQQPSQPDHGLPEIVAPNGYKGNHWVPVVMLWPSNDGSLGKQLGRSLAAGGFLVVQMDTAAEAKALGKLMADLRRKVRIAQGGLHAVILAQSDVAVQAVLAQRAEFQSVTLCADAAQAADADLQALRRLPKRRVAVLSTADVVQIRDHVVALHQQRVVAGPAGEVAQVLDSFHDAAAVADEDRYFAILPDDAVFLGTDATERWTGKQFREFAMRYFKLPSAWTYVPLQRHVTLSPDGKMAWFDEALDNEGYGECRGTGVLQRREDQWVLLQYNLTVPVPNDLMAGVARQVRRHLDGGGK